jgi:hypothetical protein
MKKQDLDFIDKIVCKYLSHDEPRAKRIIEAAYPGRHLSRNPIRKGKGNGTDLARQAG